MAEMTSKDRLKSPRLRMFVALDLPDDFLDRAVIWQERAFAGRRDLRVLSRYALHVTLVFLGYQYERDAEKIAELSFAVPAEPFELQPDEVEEVPPGRPRLYAIGLDDPGDKLTRWQTGLAERLQGAGYYEPEKRPFWPHLTVARFKQTERHRTGGRARSEAGGRGRGPAEAPESLPELPDDLRNPFQAARLTLYRSTLRPQGAVYEPLARAALGDEDTKTSRIR
jgi:2'-5' RNA ligase